MIVVPDAGPLIYLAGAGKVTDKTVAKAITWLGKLPGFGC